jgi:hypothetical protein
MSVRCFFPRFVARLVFVCLAAWLCFESAPLAWGHDPFEMTADTKLTTEAMRMRVMMSRSTAYALVQDELPKGTRFDPSIFESLVPAFQAHAGNIFEITAGGMPLELRKATVTLTQEEDVQFDLEYASPQKFPVRFRALHVQKLGYGYGASLMVVNGDNHFLGSKLLMGDDTIFDLTLPEPADGNGPVAAAKPSFSFRAYLVLGIEHIITGYDHLLFLGALLVVCRKARTIFVIVTCFTLAHSLTLGLAALDIINLSSRIVEPLIAVTIMYVALENLYLRGQEPRGRGWLTFTFGLIHGFGFASALKSTGLGRDAASLALPLFSFNLGVELGQMSVAVICLPIWWKLRSYKPVEKYGAIVMSSVVAAAGLYWFLQRTVL